MLITREHYELIDQFERDLEIKGYYARKESKDLWSKGVIYCHGETNDMFLAYRHGYAFGKAKFEGQGVEG